MEARTAVDGLPYGLLAVGLWDESQVELQWVDEPVRGPGWAEDVEAWWAELKLEEPSLFDAPLATLRGMLPVRDRLLLTFARSWYRVTAATHRDVARTMARHGVLGLGMGTACAVGLRVDGGVVLGRRSQRVLGGRGKWHPPAGHWEPDTHVDAAGHPCPFASAQIEMLEELGLASAELVDLTLIGVQLNPETSKPELHFTARVPLSLDLLAERQKAARDAHEMDGLILVGDAQVDAFLAGQLGPPTEIARGCVYLHRALGLLDVAESPGRL